MGKAGAHPWWVLMAVAGLGLGAGAHLRILHPSSGAALSWPNPGNVSIVIQADGSADIPGPSDEVAVRLAIQAWNAVTGSAANLVENSSPEAQARTDWEADDLHSVWFDETGSSGYFPGSSGVVALTPLWFFSGGQISDADVLFNGKNFQFTTRGEPGRFDVQDVATHELGHLLGLDHTGQAGATMYPYVDPTVWLHRSLSLDDAYGIRAAYPQQTFARLTGRVEREDGSPVVRAHLVAVDAQGRTAATTLSTSSGSFAIAGLSAGTYTVYADPLDNPVSAANLTGSYAVDVDFESSSYPGSFAVGAGGTEAIGTLVVSGDVPVQLGRSSDRLPRRATIGQSTLHTLRGSGLTSGSTLSASDSDVVLTPTSWLGSVVTFAVAVPAGELPGHVDVTVTNSAGQRDTLPGGLELAPPDPQVHLVQPSLGSQSGGTLVTVSGAHFAPGARVVIGDRIYLEGAVGGATLVDGQTLTLITAATAPGLHDVVVIDATGVEGRAAQSFLTTDVPSLQLVFPEAGAVQGGTPVTLLGADFVPGAEVYFGGVAALSVAVLDSSHIEAVAAPSLGTGPVSLQVVNPGGFAAGAQFTYVSQADPTLAGLSPSFGAAAGGDQVTLTGADFGPGVEVRFGVDPVDGSGGSPALALTRVDNTTLTVVTPPGVGSVAVLVRDEATGQAALLPAAYTYQGGGGGGGCGSTAAPGPGTWRDALANAGWFLALLALAGGEALRQRRRLRAVLGC
jgi:MYXO-CTERM domain-containing protein